MFAVQVFVFGVFASSLLYHLCFGAQRAFNLATQLRLSVVLYSMVGAIHHGGLLSSDSRMPWQVVELCYNLYNVRISLKL